MNQLAERTPLLIASEINSIKEQTQRMLLINSIEIGRRLVEAKTLVPHGEWGKWLEDSVDYSQRTATNLMKIFEQYGDSQLSLFGSNPKSQALANLSYTQAVALLGIPSDEREDFAKEHDVENMSTRELQQAIKEKQELELKLKDSESKARKERIAHEKLQIEFQKVETESKKHAEAVKKLKLELDNAEKSEDTEEIERLQKSLQETEGELSESLKKIKELERQLKEKPIDVPAIVETVPEAVEAELAELRAKVAKQGNEQNIAKFTFCFESLVANFKELLSTLEGIQDKAASDKYKNAVKGLIAKMSERL